MAKNFGYMQFFSCIVRYLSKADASEHIIFYGARDLKDIALSNLLPTDDTLVSYNYILLIALWT